MLKRAILLVIVLLVALSLVTNTGVSALATGMTQEQYITKVQNSGVKIDQMVSDFTESDVDKMVKLITQRFVDVNSNDWYARDLSILATRGVISGDTLEGGTKFNGSSNVTRAEMVTMLALANSSSPNELRKRELTAREFVYSIMGVTQKTSTPNQNRAIERSLREDTNISSVATKWYAKYLASLRIKLWGYARYNDEYMEKPITRGEVIHLLSGTFLINEVTNSTANSMFEVDYFQDLPETVSMFQSNGELYATNKALYDKEIGISGLLTTYYPKFEDIISGNEKLPVSVKQALNLAKHLGVYVGKNGNISNWDTPITKAEVVAMIVRTLNVDSRVLIDV